MLVLPAGPEAILAQQSSQVLWSTLPLPPILRSFSHYCFRQRAANSDNRLSHGPIQPNGFKLHVRRVKQIKPLTSSEQILLYCQLSPMHLPVVSKVSIFKVCQGSPFY